MVERQQLTCSLIMSLDMSFVTLLHVWSTENPWNIDSQSLSVRATGTWIYFPKMKTFSFSFVENSGLHRYVKGELKNENHLVDWVAIGIQKCNLWFCDWRAYPKKIMSSSESDDDDSFWNVSHVEPTHNTIEASVVVSTAHATIETTSLSDDSLVRNPHFCSMP